MRKINHVNRSRAVPCPIPRAPTPPTPSSNNLVSVQHLKNQLLNSNKHSLVSNSKTESSNHQTMKISSTSSLTAPSSKPSGASFKELKITPSSAPHINTTETVIEVHSTSDDGSCNISTSSNNSSDSDIGPAIEPDEQFPPPPEEFLEDIRAVRKQEEIEGPLDDPIPSPSPYITPGHPPFHVFDLTSHHFSAQNQRQRNSMSYNGNGSLNSSITETTESASSWSPSVSPVPSPLPSPSHSSMDSSSTTNYIISNNKSGLHQMRPFARHESAFTASSPSASSSASAPSTRFQFPPVCGPTIPAAATNFHGNQSFKLNEKLAQIHHLQPRKTSKGIVIALTGVTLAPLSTSCEKESIYQKLPTLRAPTSSHPRPQGHTQATTPGSSMFGSLPRSGTLNTGAKPPDYNTAMQRLSLSRASTSSNAIKLGQQSAVKQQAVVVGQKQQAQVVCQRQPQLIAAVNPQQHQVLHNHAKESSSTMSHPQVNFVQGSSSSGSKIAAPSSSQAHQSFSPSCSSSSSSSPVTDSASGLFVSSHPPSASSMRTSSTLRDSSNLKATQNDSHQNQPELSSSCRAFPSAREDCPPAHSDANHGLARDHQQNNFKPSDSQRPSIKSAMPSRSILNNYSRSKIESPPKKRVSFSDQVELVGLEEEYLPNPLLERVLGKAFLANNNIVNGTK